MLRFLALGQFRCESGPRIKSGDSCAACAQSFGQCALWNQFEFQFTRQHLPLELLVLADVRRHHFFYLARRQQNSHPEVIHAGVVADNREAFDAAVVQRGDEILRNPTQPESACSDGHVVVKQALKRSHRVRVDFVHAKKLTTDYPNASETVSSRVAGAEIIGRLEFRFLS